MKGSRVDGSGLWAVELEGFSDLNNLKSMKFCQNPFNSKSTRGTGQ